MWKAKLWFLFENEKKKKMVNGLVAPTYGHNS